MSKPKNSFLLSSIITCVILFLMILRIPQTKEFVLSYLTMSDFFREKLELLILIGTVASFTFNCILHYNVLKVGYKISKMRISSQNIFLIFVGSSLVQVAFLFTLPLSKAFIVQASSTFCFSLAFLILFFLITRLTLVPITKQGKIFTTLYLFFNFILSIIGNLLV